MFLALTHRKIFSVHWNKFPTKWLSAIFTESQCDNLLSYFQILPGISQSPGHCRWAHQPWGLVVVPPSHRQVQVLHCWHILADRNSEFHVTHIGLQFYIFSHDDVIKWKQFPLHWPFVRGIHWSPVDSPHKGQWSGALMFSFICAWTNGWGNNCDTGDLRSHHAHYDVTVMHISVLCKIAPRTRAHFLCVAEQGQMKVSANERKRYICNVFSHWLRICSAIDKQWAQIIVNNK